jgi:hypothetical protein
VSAQHTPGPWVVPSGPGSTNNGSRRQSVWTANGDIQIANCQSESLSLAANSANARLIAAAPELLEALRVMVDTFIDASGSHCWVEDSAMIRANEAIAKATGSAA